MAGAASALFILDVKGRCLIWRDYRGDVTSVQAERYFSKLLEKEVVVNGVHVIFLSFFFPILFEFDCFMLLLKQIGRRE